MKAKSSCIWMFLSWLLVMPQISIAESSNVLIQVLPGSVYRVWHADGPSVLEEEEIMALDAAAERTGSEAIETKLGPATARLTDQGAIIDLPAAKSDKQLLIDRDACGHVKTWHAEGGVALTDDQITDLVLAALPGGGPRVALDPERYAKAFVTGLGIMVAIWKPRVAGK